MQSITLHTPQGPVHALRIGRGGHLLLALHGFADSARMFLPLEKTMGEHYTIIAIDLPFHGQTDWAKPYFSQDDLNGIFKQILVREGKNRFSLMGFSFGARLVLGMLPLLEPLLEQIILLSPDGIKTRGMTAAELAPMWFRRAMQYLLRKPGRFLSCVDLARKWRVLPVFLHQFLHRHLKHPSRLKRVFGCWYTLPYFSVKRRTIRSVLKNTGIPTTLVVGVADPLLDAQALSRWFEGLPNVQTIKIEGGGHRLFTDMPSEILVNSSKMAY